MDIDMTPELARALLQGRLKRRKVRDEEVSNFIELWEAQEPVMPVSMMCDALRAWQQALRDNASAEGLNASQTSLREMAARAGDVFFSVSKSNLLWRLLYLGEKLRAKPCPVHRGRWSGCVGSKKETGCDGACLSGNNVTGWLPEPGDEAGEIHVPRLDLP